MHKLKQILNRILVILFRRKKVLRSEVSTNTNPAPQMLYKSLNQLPVKIFYEILETGNLELLGKANQKELTKLWSELIEEYWRLTDPINYKRRLSQSTQIIMWQNEINVLFGALVLADLGDKRGIDAMRYFKCSSIEQTENRINVLKTKINIKVFEIEQKENKGSVKKLNFYKDLAVLEQILNRTIDHEKTTVIYWIELNKLAKQLSDGRNKKR